MLSPWRGPSANASAMSSSPPTSTESVSRVDLEGDDGASNRSLLAENESRQDVLRRSSSAILGEARRPSHALIRQNSTTRVADQQAVRMNVFQDGVMEARNTRYNRIGVILGAIINLPLIFASIIVLSLYWQQGSEIPRVRLWCLVEAIHSTLYLALDYILYRLEAMGSTLSTHGRESLLPRFKNFRYALELFGLFWFLTGNMWIISSEVVYPASALPLYHLALSLIIIMYIKIFFPCILALISIPIICFCLPCLLRMLQNLYPEKNQGMSKERLDQIETVHYQTDVYGGNEATTTCAICLCNYEENQTLRVLPCGHLFHVECVDEWLVTRANCPTCRYSLSNDPSNETGENSVALNV